MIATPVTVATTEKGQAMVASRPNIAAVRSSGGSAQPLSPPRTVQPSRHTNTSSLSASQPHSQDAVDCLQADCSTCAETKKRGFVYCRLPCGHTVRAQIIDVVPEHAGGCSAVLAAPGHRSESPPPLTAQRDRDQTGSSPPPRTPPRSIMRQTSGPARIPVPAVGILLASMGGSSSHPPAPLSPPRGSPSSPQQTPGTMYRIASNASTTSFKIPRDDQGHLPQQGDGTATQQMTSRSNSGASGVTGREKEPSRLSLGMSLGTVRYVQDTSSSAAAGSSRDISSGKSKRHGSDVTLRVEAALDGQGRRQLADATTVAEVVTDSRGDVLHKMCSVILYAPQQGAPDVALKVRGQIIGTFWDERDIGPPVDCPGEVQIMVTYVDASERNVPLLFPTRYAQTFGETETTEGNIIKWKAALCKVGKKFT